METNELLKKVRQIEIKARDLSQNIFAGEYHTAFKGRGMTFAEVREYQYGDDVRDIDWNVTARLGKPYIKIYEEERELTVILLIDISKSLNFGSSHEQKKSISTLIAATLAFSTIQNNDKIGVIFFTDKVEKFIPPQKGKKHVLHIIRELLNIKPSSPKTDLSEALKYFTNAIKKSSTAFIISDFMDSNFAHNLTIANRKHDIAALQIYDSRETEIPNIGIVKLKDPETEERMLIDTADKRTLTSYKQKWNERQLQLQKTFQQCGVDYVTVNTKDDYAKSLLQLFRLR